jgi:hypothetical protein
MRKLQQTRLHTPPNVLGNCYPTVVACFLDLDSPEDVIQIQEKYSEKNWEELLKIWLQSRGWACKKLNGHLNDDSFYTVTGSTSRGTTHICVYKNGSLYHDPHPSNEGLISEVLFETFVKFEKECFKCEKVKPVTEYYRHKKMGDGYLGKCKSCTISDAKQTNNLKTSTPEGLEKERERHRDKYRRLNYKELQKEWNKGQSWKSTSTYKGLRKRKYKNLSREFELHHWNYDDDYLEDVFILNIKDHKNLHNSIFLDLERRIFYLKDGTYLDTREKHEEYIKKIEIEIKTQ